MCICEKSNIILDTSTLEKIFHDPHNILQNEESFWEDEKPQKYTRRWAENVGYEIPYDKWRGEMEAWAKLSPKEREESALSQITRTLVEGKEAFLAQALPHLCSFLPEGVDLGVPIRFTAFVPPNAFALEDIFVSVSSPHWHGNVQNILNLLVHEICHVGYGFYRDQQTETKLEDETLYRMLDNMVNEGFCTYVGYKALPIFPAPDEDDYKLLENPAEVRRLIRDVNEVFSRAGALSEDELKKLVWDRCIIGRGYYVAGATMCRTIDESLGRDALIEALLTGPRTVVRVFNSLVDEELKCGIDT